MISGRGGGGCEWTARRRYITSLISQSYIGVIDFLPSSLNLGIVKSSHRSAAPTASRDQILEALRWQTRTVDELADGMGLTRNGVRAQLLRLESDGLVVRSGLRHAGTVGKPPALYALTLKAERGSPIAYPAALTAIIETLRAGLAPEAFRTVLTTAGERLSVPGPGQTAAGVLESLGATVKSATTASGGTRVEGASCPLAATVSQEPVTCELVRSLLAKSLNRSVEMRCHHGDRPRCCFEIAPPSLAARGA